MNYIVDRSFEHNGDDSWVSVFTPSGEEIRFWLTGLSDAEYIRRAKAIEMKESIA